MKFDRMGNSHSNTYKEKSYELAEETSSIFDGKFAKIHVFGFNSET